MTVKVLSRAYVATTCALWLVLTPPSSPDAAPSVIGVLLVALATAASERFTITVVIRRSAMNSAMTTAVMALATLVLGPVPAVFGVLLGTLPVWWTSWRKRAHAGPFNGALFSTETWLIAWVMGAFSEGVAADGATMALLVTAAVLAAELLSLFSVMGVIHVHSGLVPGSARQIATAGMLNTLLVLPIAVFLVFTASVAMWALVPLTALVALVIGLGRSQHGLAGTRVGVISLYEFLGQIEGERDTATLVRLTLDEAARALTSVWSGLLVVGPDRAELHAMGEDGVTTHPVPRAQAVDLIGLVPETGSLEVSQLATITPMHEDGAPHVVAAPFTAEATQGLLLVQREAKTHELLGADDLQLAQAIARNAGRALLTVDMLHELEQRAEDLQRAAQHDPTTGLRNADGLAADVPELARGAVVVVELLDLPSISSALGRRVAVDAERATADRLQVLGQVHHHEVAHIGFGRFAVVMPGAGRSRATGEILQVRDILSGTLTDAQGFGLEARVAVGATITTHVQPIEELLRQATNAVQQQDRSRADVAWFTRELDEAATDRLELAADLRGAIDRRELSLAFQPKVDITTGRITGAEALSRWIHPERGFVSPVVFIEIAERTGLIHDLTRAVITAAVQQAAAWDAAGHPLSVAVNLSTMSLEDDGLADWIVGACQRAGLPPSRLTCEVTETQVMGDVERCRATLQRLRDAGLRLSIDDFGTGHSSLAQLKTMPVDELKIDRAFVMHLAEDDVDRAIVRTIIEMARTFGLTTVAEGIEDAATLLVLAELGCDLAQGYHLHRPMPASALDEILAALTVR